MIVLDICLQIFVIHLPEVLSDSKALRWLSRPKISFFGGEVGREWWRLRLLFLLFWGFFFIDYCVELIWSLWHRKWVYTSIAFVVVVVVIIYPLTFINSSQCFTLFFRKHGIILALQEWCMTWIKMNSLQILGRYRLHSITLQNVCAVAENHVVESDFNSVNFGIISWVDIVKWSL